MHANHIVLTSLAILVFAAPATAQVASFQILPLTGPSGPEGRLQGISGDGRVVLNSAKANFFPWQEKAAIWSSDRGLEILDQSTARGTSNAMFASDDGSVVVGYQRQGVFRWTRAGGFSYLGILTGEAVTQPLALSADGTTILLAGHSSVGLWTPDKGIRTIPLPPGFSGAIPTVMSASGRWFAGLIHQTTIYVWDLTSDPRIVLTAPAGIRLSLQVVSDDASSFAGVYYGENAYGLFRVIGSNPIELIPLPRALYPGWEPRFSRNMRAAAGEGNINNQYITPYIWREGEGLVALASVTGNTFPVGLWGMRAPSAISADGSVVAGFFYTDPAKAGWVATLDPRPACFGDLNADGVVDDQDFLVFAGA